MSLKRIYIDHSMTHYFFESIVRELSRETGEEDAEATFYFLKDVDEFIMNNQQELVELTTSMMMEEINKTEYTRFIENKRDTIEMNALKQNGMAKNEIDEYRRDLVDIIISSAFELGGGRFIQNPNNSQNTNIDS